MQEINRIEFKEKKNLIKDFTRNHKVISYVIIYAIIQIIVFNVLNVIFVPSKAEVAELCEKHLRISRNFENIERYENAYSEVLNNGDTIITVKTNFYEIKARYDKDNILIGELEEIYTIPFWPYILYVTTCFVSLIIGLIIISILKKNQYFKSIREM